MNLTELYDTISTHVSGNNQSLSLTSGLLNSLDITDLLTNVLSLSQLDLSNAVVPATPGATDTSFTVSGSLATQVYSLATPAAAFQFFVDTRGQAQVIISLTLPGAWKFTDSFSGLKDSYFNLFPESTEEFIFDDLSLSNAFLVLDSLGAESGSIETWNKGLNFSADLDVQGSIALAFAHFILPNTLSLQGSIDNSQAIPLLQLQADLSQNTDIGYLSNLPLSLVIATQERTIWPTEDPEAVSYIQLISNITAGDGANAISIPLTLEASYYAVTADLEANMSGIGVNNLAVFSDLVNNVDLASIIPAEVQTNQGLQFSSLSLTVNVEDYTIDSVSIWLEVNKIWPVIEDTASFLPLSATQLKFNFLVDNPLSSTDRVVTFSAITQISKWAILEEIIELQDLEALLTATSAGGTTTISGHLSGAVVLGNSVTLGVFFPIPLSSGNVQFESSEPIDLPGLDSLSKFIGGDDFADLMPEEIAQLSHFTLAYANLELDLSKPGLEAFQIILTTTNDWIFLDGKITVRDVNLNLDVQAPTGARTIDAALQGVITFGSTDPVDIHLFGNYSSTEGGVQLWGATGEGQSIPIGDLINDLINKFGAVELPDILTGLVITNLQVAFDTATKDFSFLCETAIIIDETGADDDKVADLRLQIDVVNTTAGYTKAFSGLLTVGARVFSVDFSSSSDTSGGVTTEKTSLEAAFRNEDGEPIDIVTELVDQVSNSSPLTLTEYNLTTLILYELQLNYEKTTIGSAPSTTQYGIIGDFGWEPSFDLGDGESTFKVRALIDLTKQSGAGQSVLGSVCGSIETPIPGLDFLSLKACYKMDEDGNGNPDNSLVLSLLIGKLLFEASYSNTDSVIDLAFSVNVKDGDELTLGEIVTFFASLADPSIDEFEFDPPWNFISEFDLAPFLNSMVLELSITKATKEKKFGIVFTEVGRLVPGSLSSILTIRELGLEYSSLTKKANIILDAVFLGQSQELKWDPINDAPPEIPGQGAAIFDLRYLGMGQHVAFTQAANVSSIKEVMDLLRGVIDDNQRLVNENRSLKLRNPLEMFGDDSVISFSPESEWLVGLDVSLLKTLSLSVIFNDPVIYGLRIELYGEHAKNFAGLQFEILYQKISPTIGKYHVDLTLPDFVRHLQFGAVSVTLPIIVVDIFTNGDFKVDLGFPWNFNFARSFAIEVFPFTGAGGFYFNKLSAATATSTPVIPASKGVFTPVYEFGLGLRIGLGKTFNKGPLKAEISIVVQGIVEGVISWFNPADGSERVLYYKISGGVAIVGRLYGEVDFAIISVSIEVIAKAMIQFVIEVYQPILIDLTAEVSVKASVKVAFIRVRFSFSLTVKQSFTIPSPQKETAPWLT